MDIYNHLGRSLNVAYLYGAWETPVHVQLVMELCTGGCECVCVCVCVCVCAVEVGGGLVHSNPNINHWGAVRDVFTARFERDMARMQCGSAEHGREPACTYESPSASRGRAKGWPRTGS